MSQKLLGMYIHMHWGYHYPYAARTWRLEDWEAYLNGLKELGYNFVQIWPMIDIMPKKLTTSDWEHLEKLRQVIRIAKRLEMTVFVGASANTLGNTKAENYEFAARPYFVAERRINPANPAEIRELMEARRIFIEPLAEADGFWIIDGDPGGFENSPVSEFVDLFAHHRKLLDQLRSGIELVYWMWQGWRGVVEVTDHWGDHPDSCWEGALRGLKQLNPEPWGILARDPGHFASVDALELNERTLFFPYTIIEGEPNYPMTNFDPQRIEDGLSKIAAEKYPRGILGNAQSHCLQLPHTYLFKHFTQGGKPGDTHLSGFAGQILPGNGEVLAQAWEALAGDDWDALNTAQKNMNLLLSQASFQSGKLSGLYFHQLKRLVEDLRLQIAVQIAILKMNEALSRKSGIQKNWAELTQAIQNWSGRHGFKDRYYGGLFKELLHPVLKKLAGEIEHGEIITLALKDFETGERHDAFDRLLKSLLKI